MTRSISILLAEPNLLLLQKLAAALTRHPAVWCVALVGDRDGLQRAAARVRPELVLADLNLLRDTHTVEALRKCAAQARILALVDAADDDVTPYRDACARLGLDGAAPRTRVVDAVSVSAPPAATAPPVGDGR
jgi:adenylate cyclase